MDDDIFYAAMRGDEGLVTSLLDASPALLRSVDRKGDTPLVVAILSQELGVVQLLIARGADIHARGRFNCTALHWAARINPEVTRLLLSKGAQASVLDDENRTPLIEASIQGHVGVVPLLVQHMGGQGLDQPDNEGRTALHWAARLGNEEVVRCLLLAGCDPAIRDKKGRTPRAEAEWRANDWRERGERSEGCAKCVTVLKVRGRIGQAHTALVPFFSRRQPSGVRAAHVHLR
jgi:ankyrin repeat protein